MTGYEKVNLILELFTRDGAHNFSRDELGNDLSVAIRVSMDFHDSLTKWGESLPEEHEVDYVVQTIRSGMEWFLNVRNLYRGLDTSGANRSFAWAVATEYPAIREAYLRIFPELTKADLKVAERLDCLLTQCQIQLVFLATNFRQRIKSHRASHP